MASAADKAAADYGSAREDAWTASGLTKQGLRSYVRNNHPDAVAAAIQRYAADPETVATEEMTRAGIHPDVQQQLLPSLAAYEAESTAAAPRKTRR